MENDDIFLIQTDTTVGFLSKNDDLLSKIKGRNKSKKTLEVVADFSTLLRNTRVPDKFKNRIRRSKKTTFIYPNKKAFRVVDIKSKHNLFLNRFGKFYSTSANYTNKPFKYDFAFDKADIVVDSMEGYHEKIPSSIYKLGKLSISKIR